MKKIIVVLMMFIASFNFVGCDEDAEQKQSRETEQILGEIDKQIGMPNIKNFQEKKLAKLVMEQRDRSDLICYAYLKSEMTGKLIFIGKCVGFGLPYSVQFTNPQKVENYTHGIILPQADPNGLYMPESAQATWLLMVDPNGGDPKPVYIEPEVVVSPFPLH